MYGQMLGKLLNSFQMQHTLKAALSFEMFTRPETVMLLPNVLLELHAT